MRNFLQVQLHDFRSALVNYSHERGTEPLLKTTLFNQEIWRTKDNKALFRQYSHKKSVQALVHKDMIRFLPAGYEMQADTHSKHFIPKSVQATSNSVGEKL